MNKFAGIAALLITLTTSAVAFAAPSAGTVPAEYTGGSEYEATVNAEDRSTVKITDPEGDVVYLGQENDGFSVGEVFKLESSDLDIGKYNVILNNSNGDKYETYFYVGVDAQNSENDVYMTRLQNEKHNTDNDTYNIAYYADVIADDFDNYQSLKVGLIDGETKYYAYPLKDDERYNSTSYPTTSGSGSIYLFFQLNDVPEEYKDSATVFLSADPALEGGGSGE